MPLPPPDQLRKEHIDVLIDQGVPETRSIEYKEALPGGADDDTAEFLADVVSFANAAGGYILYGVRGESDEAGAATGAPEAAPGIEENQDQARLRLDQKIRSGVAPRIPGLAIEAVPGFEQGPVLAVWIPRSLAAPHMVNFKNRTRFYGRNDAGKFQLSIDEIRAAFLHSQESEEALSRFRLERIARISSGDAPTPCVRAESSCSTLHRGIQCALPGTSTFRPPS